MNGAAQFDGWNVGWLHRVRDIPGFLAIGVIEIKTVMRDQLVGMVSPEAGVVLAAGMASISLLLALMIPRHPEPGHETIFACVIPAPAE
ncbi:hypothetical protein O4H61_17245 [Roseovarius aestuarii]|nr:hypothetical protein [Roseovarius aestuarii]